MSLKKIDHKTGSGLNIRMRAEEKKDAALVWLLLKVNLKKWHQHGQSNMLISSSSTQMKKSCGRLPKRHLMKLREDSQKEKVSYSGINTWESNLIWWSLLSAVLKMCKIRLLRRSWKRRSAQQEPIVWLLIQTLVLTMPKHALLPQMVQDMHTTNTEFCWMLQSTISLLVMLTVPTLVNTWRGQINTVVTQQFTSQLEEHAGYQHQSGIQNHHWDRRST